ncbi:MAG TPA: tRNA pseudouridine(55) synthase TruB [Nannocystis sp.]|jgi:tRNA pseudouridine55 synthase
MAATAAGSAPWGVLLVDKPVGPTSHDVVGWVRWAIGEQQVGHCGTLDPAASGLLVICVGSATRLVPYLTGVDKIYRARFILGRSTTTEDREGATLEQAAVTPEIHAAARHALAGLHGALMLPPPAFSAVKIAGRRAHELARRGDVVELPPRPMTVLDVSDLEADRDDAIEPWLDATMTVSKGTYIRALAVELGRRAGIPAHLGALRRLASGSLALDDPRTVRDIVCEPLPDPLPGLPPKLRLRWPAADSPRDATREALRAALIDPCDALDLPRVAIAADDPRMSALTRLRCGQSVAVDAAFADLPAGRILGGEGLAPAARLVLHDAAGLVIVRREVTEDGERLRPERVLAPATPAGAARE